MRAMLLSAVTIRRMGWILLFAVGTQPLRAQEFQFTLGVPVEIVSPEARRAAALLVKMPDVHSVEVVDNRLTVRTRNPTKFFSHVSDLVLKHEVEVQQFTTIDASADAVFSYLQPRSS